MCHCDGEGKIIDILRVRFRSVVHLPTFFQTLEPDFPEICARDRIAVVEHRVRWGSIAECVLMVEGRKLGV